MNLRRTTVVALAALLAAGVAAAPAQADRRGPDPAALQDGLDAMAALCAHPDVLASTGARPRFSPRRICPKCGLTELQTGDPQNRALVGRPTTHVSVDEYLVREGLVLRKLGINL